MTQLVSRRTECVSRATFETEVLRALAGSPERDRSTGSMSRAARFYTIAAIRNRSVRDTYGVRLAASASPE
jgi:hypothetical protein